MNGNGNKWIVAGLIILAIGALIVFARSVRDKIHAGFSTLATGKPSVSGPQQAKIGTMLQLQLAGFKANSTFEVMATGTVNGQAAGLPRVATSQLGTAAYSVYLDPSLLPDTLTLHFFSAADPATTVALYSIKLVA